MPAKRQIWLVIGLISLLFFLPPLLGSPRAGEQEERLILVGLKLFPSFLSADQSIQNKLNEQGELLLLVVYQAHDSRAKDLADELQRKGKVQDFPVKIATVPIAELPKYAKSKVAGLFLVEPLVNGVDELILFGQKQQALVFSPFKGDVEKGVASGISVTDRVLPYINTQALASANIVFKSFFLRVAKHYEN